MPSQLNINLGSDRFSMFNKKRDIPEVNGLKVLRRQQSKNGTSSAYVFVNERGQPFGRMGIGRMIERAGEAAGLPFPVHVHMCSDTRPDTHWRDAEWTPGGFSITSGMPRSPTRCVILRCRRSRSRTYGVNRPAPHLHEAGQEIARHDLG